MEELFEWSDGRILQWWVQTCNKCGWGLWKVVEKLLQQKRDEWDEGLAHERDDSAVWKTRRTQGMSDSEGVLQVMSDITFGKKT